MNTVNVKLSATHDFQPQTINGIECDGIVNGRPVTIRRNRFGGVVPAIGSSLPTTYGTARVVGYVDGAVKVAVTEFDEDYAFETHNIENPDILTAEECVERLSECANRGIESLASDIRRLYSTETGNLSKQGKDMMATLDHYEPNEYRMHLTSSYENYWYAEDVEVVCDYVHSFLLANETPSERRKRQAIERKQAVALANKLLEQADNTDIPEDIQAEMAECFGEF